MMTNLLNGAHVANKLFSTIARLRLLLVMFVALTVSAEMWAEEVTETFTFGSSSISGWTCSPQSSYCGLYYSGKNNNFVVYNNAITNISSINFSSVTAPTITIRVKGITNNGTNSFTVSLIDNSGNELVTSDVQEDQLKNTSNNTEATWSKNIVLTPVLGVTGYKITCYAKTALAGTDYKLTYTLSGEGNSGGNGGDEESSDNATCGWIETDISDIESTDDVVITMTNATDNTYALTNDNGTNGAPRATELTIENGAIVLPNVAPNPADNILWNITKEDNDQLKICPKNNSSIWLYVNSNTGDNVRVGSTSNAISNGLFIIEGTYLKNVTKSYYIGAYISDSKSEWRCYANTTGNIANQTLKFYKYVECGSTEPRDCSLLKFTTNITEYYTANYAQDAEATPLTISAQYDNSANGVTYQWYSNTTNSDTDGTLISDATSASYTPLTTTTGTTYYYCVATYNEECTIASNVATVTITAPVPTFTVTFDSDGGSAVEQQTIEDGETATEPADPTKTGHTFGGWYKGDTKFDFTTPITSNITLKAKWTIDSYTLTWNVNGGDDLTSTYTSGSVEYGTAITQPDDPTREGYRFSGWHDGTAIVTPATTMPAENLTYTAQWKKEHTIKWIVNGDTDTPYETTYVVGDDALVLPSNPNAPSTCEDKVFVGWTESATVNADGNGIEYVDEDTKPNTDKTYYAVFASLDGDAAGDYKKVTSELSDWSGEYLIVYETSETIGVAFDGSGSTEAELDKTFNSVDVAIEDATISASSDMDNVSFTIGKIDNENYYIQSNSGVFIGTESSNSNDLKVYNTTYPHQIYWETVANFTEKDEVIIYSVIDGYPSPAILQYNDREGQKRFRYHISYEEPISLYRKSSYADYTTVCVETYNVKYDANGATSGDVPVDENNYISGATVTVLGNIGNLQKTHYSFVGWNTQADGNGTSYQAGITFTITEDVTLYAIWKELPQYSVTWYVNGKQLTDIELSGASTTVYEGDRITETPPAPNSEDFCGQVFVGWTDAEMDVNNTDKPTIYNLVDEFPTASGDQTFYAVFADYDEQQ